VFTGDFVKTEFRTEEDRIAFFVSTFAARNVPMFGQHPPSEVARQIPQPEKRNLTLLEGGNDLRRITGRGETEYRNVYIRRPDLWRHIRHLRQARRVEDI
jgi:hypothetical protein